VTRADIRCSRNRDSIPAGIEDVSLLHCVQTGSGAQQALHSMDDGRFLPGVNGSGVYLAAELYLL